MRLSPSTLYSKVLKALIWALPLASCVTLGKLLTLSVPERPHPKTVIENRPATWVAVGMM